MARPTLKLIIAGSRTISDFEMLNQALYKFAIPKDIEVVCGMARGADTLGHDYALENNLTIRYFPANWKMHRKAAGFKRNIEMGDYADALLALWDGKSPGTYHMIHYMKSLGKPVYIFYPTDCSDAYKFFS